MKSPTEQDILEEIGEIYKRLESYDYEAKTIMDINMKDPNLNLETPDTLLMSAMLHLGQHQAYMHILNALNELKNKFNLK